MFTRFWIDDVSFGGYLKKYARRCCSAMQSNEVLGLVCTCYLCTAQHLFPGQESCQLGDREAIQARRSGSCINSSNKVVSIVRTGFGEDLTSGKCFGHAKCARYKLPSCCAPLGARAELSLLAMGSPQGSTA